MLQRFASHPPARGKRPIRALVLTPTRELAAQVAESFETYGRGLGIWVAVVFGGVGQNPQVIELRRGVDVLVATPGRLLDLASQGEIDFGRLEVFVLDEADGMLDMGFLPDVRRVIAMLPKRRQTLLFSATMPNDIRELAGHILIDPVHVAVTPVASTAVKIDQSVFFVAKSNKRVPVATDIAARGLDVEGVSHVVHFDLPEVAESYVHRIGRTARAGAGGTAFSFCYADEQPCLRAIERLIRMRVRVVTDHPHAEVHA